MFMSTLKFGFGKTSESGKLSSSLPKPPAFCIPHDQAEAVSTPKQEREQHNCLNDIFASLVDDQPVFAISRV